MKKKVTKKGKNRKTTSSLQQHKKVNKTLIAPMMQLSDNNLTFCSWMNIRLPEMLWACLVISVLPRNDALIIFKDIATLGYKYRNMQKDENLWDLTHSLLPKLPKDIFLTLVEKVIAHPLGYAALRPLLLLNQLPYREQWESAIGVDADNHDWQTLVQAVTKALDHQSQESTDVRWLIIMFKIASGLIFVSNNMNEIITCIVNYPHQGDMREIRPSIRSMEIAFRTPEQKLEWCNSFWQECLKKTRCTRSQANNFFPITLENEEIARGICEVQLVLLQHWDETLSTSDIDARHDAVFGFALYALALLLESLNGRNRVGIVGRLILKSLVDCRITLAYLLLKDETKLWLKYRNFGSGQAKLALLKLNDLEDKPAFISNEILEQLANEDAYQEFVNIELGHWCNQDLRKMSEISGTKNDYDKYYSWTSTYSHGQWSALRDACLTTCYNPLHRLHRIPRLTHRAMEDILPDAIYLVDSILREIGKAYPGFDATITQELHRHKTEEAST